MTRSLHAYQRRAVEHLHAHPRAALFADMGLGKTAIVLSALTPEHLPALVIAPKRVTEHVWPREAETWRPDLYVRLATGSPAQRIMAADDPDPDVVVLGRDNLGDLEARHARRFRTVVLDECAGFKSVSSNRFKLARRLTRHTPHVWLLSGTPTPNGLMDLWTQLFLIDRGERLGPTITGYRREHFVDVSPPSVQWSKWALREGHAALIHAAVEDVCLSMSAADHLDLPPVTHNRVEVTLPRAARFAYDNLRESLVTMAESVPITATNAAVLTGKLSQLSAGFLYDEYSTSHRLHDAKLKALAEIREGTGSPLLVFYQFKAELAALREMFPDAERTDDAGALERWNAGQVRMLLAHPASAGHGLNLQAGGHTAVWLTLPWSMELYRQANARLVRQGQTKPVMIHHVMAADTVDDVILSTLTYKQDIEHALLTHLKG